MYLFAINCIFIRFAEGVSALKFIHLSDLHLGKRVNEFSMREDQEHILASILDIVRDECPHAVLIAGDVYDKSVPSAEAVELFDGFLVHLRELCPHIFAISGNHDSPERLAFGARLMDAGGVHISPVYSGELSHVTLSDEHGEADIYMLPFVKPSSVRRFFPDAEIQSYTDAVAAALSAAERREGVRSVLLAHQFVTGAETCESEERAVGGLDNVDASVFEGFDYVALGHIHGPQNVGTERIRYCGTPLKYSFSEAGHRKSVTVAELGAGGELRVSTRPLQPLRDMAELRGSYEQLINRDFYEGTSLTEDYVRVTLTDEQEQPNAMAMLRTVYHNIMRLEYDNISSRSLAAAEGGAPLQAASPAELFADFFSRMNGRDMDVEQTEFLSGLIEEIWEGER